MPGNRQRRLDSFPSADELMVDSAAPSCGQNIQKMMITMVGKIDGTANEITEVKSLATNTRTRPRKPALRLTFSVQRSTLLRRTSLNCREAGTTPPAHVPAKVTPMTRERGLSLLENSLRIPEVSTSSRQSRSRVSSPSARNLRREEQRVSRRRRQCGCT